MKRKEKKRKEKKRKGRKVKEPLATRFNRSGYYKRQTSVVKPTDARDRDIFE